MHVNTYLFPRAVQGLACPQSQHDADCLETYALQYSAASPISLKSALKELHMCVALLELMRDDVIWDLQPRSKHDTCRWHAMYLLGPGKMEVQVLVSSIEGPKGSQLPVLWERIT